MPILRKGGVPVMKGGRALTRAIEDNADLRHWRQQVASLAAEQMGGEPLWDGAVSLCLRFLRPRPKSHFGTGKNASKLKASADPHPIQRPDTVKLTRAVEDALTGVVWRDDSQVVHHELDKCWGERFELRVTIRHLKSE